MAITLIKNPDERNDPPKPLMEHLMALRDMFVFGIGSWLAGAIVAGCFTPKIYRMIEYPAVQAGYAERLQAFDLLEGIRIVLTIGLWGGFVLAFPFIVYAILRFIFPALTKREKVVLLSGLLISATLFSVGAVLAYFETLPLVVSSFMEISEWVGVRQDQIRIASYISPILKLIIAFGLVFQVPLILVLLGWMGIVSSQTLRDKRRFAIVFSFVLAMFLTPPDPMSQILMAVPLCILYEVSIWIIWLKEKMSFRRNRR